MIDITQSERYYIDRLKREFIKHEKLIIGFDFDNTVYDYHNAGLDTTKIVDLLRRCSYLGFIMCIYTIDSGKEGDMNVLEKIKYCNDRDIKVHHVNTSPVLAKGVKPYFNILLDDRAGLVSSYNTLYTTLKELNLIYE